jgi:DNA-binding NarL/FixJ family response regulator
MRKAILIADDNAGVRRALRHVLEENGDWEVCAEAVDGGDAIEKEDELRPDLVILDFSMPVMNGLEVARALKKVRPGLPLIMFTIFKDRHLETEAFAAGVSAVISKENGIEALEDHARVLLQYSTNSPSSRE